MRRDWLSSKKKRISKVVKKIIHWLNTCSVDKDIYINSDKSPEAAMLANALANTPEKTDNTLKLYTPRCVAEAFKIYLRREDVGNAIMPRQVIAYISQVPESETADAELVPALRSIFQSYGKEESELLLKLFQHFRMFVGDNQTTTSKLAIKLCWILYPGNVRVQDGPFDKTCIIFDCLMYNCESIFGKKDLSTMLPPMPHIKSTLPIEQYQEDTNYVREEFKRRVEYENFNSPKAEVQESHPIMSADFLRATGIESTREEYVLEKFSPQKPKITYQSTLISIAEVGEPHEILIDIPANEGNVFDSATAPEINHSTQEIDFAKASDNISLHQESRQHCISKVPMAEMKQFFSQRRSKIEIKEFIFQYPCEYVTVFWKSLSWHCPLAPISEIQPIKTQLSQIMFKELILKSEHSSELVKSLSFELEKLDLLKRDSSATFLNQEYLAHPKLSIDEFIEELTKSLDGVVSASEKEELKRDHLPLFEKVQHLSQVKFDLIQQIESLQTRKSHLMHE